ncbi:MAG: GGDEF domain-containing protein [Polyangiaceae bacterium]|nr:GGDEF domain-containing protein [Polyangiaceae bacterium]
MRKSAPDFGDQTVETTISRDALGQVTFAQQACLVVLAGPRIGQRVALAGKALSIGRGSKNRLIFDADSVSRQHASIEWTGAAHQVKDLGSTNGTFVNERRVIDCVLKDSDRVQLGKVLLKYISSGNIESVYHAEIQRLTRFDGLTGVPNRRHFDEVLESEFTQLAEHQRPLSVVVFDLDHFKQVNDKHGHPAGDSVLRQVAERVAKVLGSELFLARTGGEEFAVVCPGMPVELAGEVAERIRACVEAERYMFDGTAIPMTVSLGVAAASSLNPPNIPALLGEADRRLYVAKSHGRNRVCST